MGAWRIIVEGVGPHDNGDPAIDADRAARDLVTALETQGQRLTRAQFLVLSDPGTAQETLAQPATDLLVPLPAPSEA